MINYKDVATPIVIDVDHRCDMLLLKLGIINYITFSNDSIR